MCTAASWLVISKGKMAELSRSSGSPDQDICHEQNLAPVASPGVYGA